MAVASLQRFFQAGQRGQRATDTPVAGARIVLECFANGEGTRETAAVKITQKGAVCRAGKSHFGRVFVAHRPADVVMATHIGAPGRP